MARYNIEHTAEDLISYKLQQCGLWIAKPKFDVLGTDLIVFVDFETSIKFGRVQCKGRTLSLGINKSAKIEVINKYVYDEFLLFLYLDKGDYKSDIYLFTAEQIVSVWKINKRGNYYLSIRNNDLEWIGKYLFTSERAQEIIELINHSNSRIEYLLQSAITSRNIQNNALKKVNDIQKLIHQCEISALNMEICTLKIEDLKRQKEELLAANKCR